MVKPGTPVSQGFPSSHFSHVVVSPKPAFFDLQSQAKSENKRVFKQTKPLLLAQHTGI